MAQDIYITIPKHSERSIERKYWTKVRTKFSWTNSKSWISMSNFKIFVRYTTPSALLTVTPFFLLVGSLPISSFPLQVSHASSIFNLLGSPRQTVFNITDSHNGHSRPPFREPLTCLAKLAFLSHKGRFHTTFLLSLPLKI